MTGGICKISTASKNQTVERNRYMNTRTRSTKKSSPRDPQRFKRRHGSTIFYVNVHFNAEAGETASDKIARLLRNETAFGKVLNL